VWLGLSTPVGMGASLRRERARLPLEFFLNCLFFLLFLEVILFYAQHLNSALQEDVKFVAVVSLMEGKLGSGEEFVAELAADLRQMLDIDISLLEELVFFNEGNEVVEVSLVSIFGVLFEDLHNHLKRASMK
jgi:hypothetical protein